MKSDLTSASQSSKTKYFLINECLIPQHQTISYVFRRENSEFLNLISGSNSIDGKIYVWVKPPNPNKPGAKDVHHAIKNHARFLDFCNTFVSFHKRVVETDEFLDSNGFWNWMDFGNG